MANAKAHDDRRAVNIANPTADPTTSAKPNVC